MFRFTWREIVLVLAIVVLGGGWFWHGRRLDRDFKSLQDRLIRLETEANEIRARPVRSSRTAAIFVVAPEHSDVSLFPTLYVEKGR